MKLLNIFFILVINFLFYFSNVLSCNYGFAGDNCDECGVQNVTPNAPNARIIGGILAKEDSWPSMATIVFRYKLDLNIQGVNSTRVKKVLCGGTLIDRDSVLTVANCFIRKSNLRINGTDYPFRVELNQYHRTFQSMYTVYLGIKNMTEAYNDLPLTSGYAFNITNFIRHPKFNRANLLNDIAIIKLANNASLSQSIQIACLPNPALGNYPKRTNIDAFAVGWGVLKWGGPLPFQLYNVKLSIYDKSYCRDVWPQNRGKDWSKQICAGRYRGGKDTCQGDGGGPLFTRDVVNGVRKYVLAGITSYGDGCAVFANPGVYTRVSPYLQWINNNS